MAASKLLLSFLFSSCALAQSSLVTSIPWYGDSQPLVASVINADQAAVTYLLNCPAGTDSDDCGTYDNVFSVGSDFFGATVSDSTAFQFSQYCTLSSATPVYCTESAGGPEANFPGISSGTPDDFGYDSFTYVPMTITAGLEKLAEASASPTSSLPLETASTSSSAPASSTPTASDSQSTSAAPLSTSGASQSLMTTSFTSSAPTGSSSVAAVSTPSTGAAARPTNAIQQGFVWLARLAL